MILFASKWNADGGSVGQLSPAAGNGPVRAYHLNSDSGTLSRLWHARISLISTLFFSTECSFHSNQQP